MTKRNAARLPAPVCTLVLMGLAASTWPEIAPTVDPLTRHVHVTYSVPADAPEEVVVVCSWSPAGTEDWRPAKAWPLISETAFNLLPDATWAQWIQQNRIVERRAAGLERTVIFNPYPEAQADGVVDVDFRVVLESPQGRSLATSQGRVQADNSDVLYIEDWSRVLQKAVVNHPAPEGRLWSWRTELDPSAGASLDNALYGDAGPAAPLPQLTYPLDLRGPYAVFVCTTPGEGSIRLRLTGDERTDGLFSPRLGEEVLWRWARLDRQMLVLRQPHRYTGWAPAHIDYVKLVPLTLKLTAQLEAQFGGTPDKLVVGYWEPYSWAFHDNVQETLQHRQPLAAFAEARIGLVDTQIGRFGAKVVYESQLTDTLLYATRGDPIGAIAKPETDNVGRMQQYTNTLDATLRYARELGLHAHANFGASNCYPGSPLQGDFSKQHPDWMRGSMLRYEVPEVRAYVLSLFREALEIGAPGISIDYCRYPETIDAIETGNAFMGELRGLADDFGAKRGRHVPILVRFPGTGVRRCRLFDYVTWAREGWVDYLCPSNIQGRHLHIDVTPYLEAVQGSQVKLLPSVDALSWGLPMPGPFLWRVARLYEAGVPGIHVYQADARILGRPGERRCMRLLANADAVRRWWAEDTRLRPRCSKGIYITRALRPEGWHGWKRLRVWPEGIDMGAVELYLDGELVSRFDGPPYLLGSEAYASDGVIPPGDHELRIRAEDGDGWLDQTFTVHGAG